MLIAFIILLLFTTELIYQIANDFKEGFNPYPFGTPIFLAMNHFVLLVMCIRYCGWLFGIIAFLMHFFAGLHATYSWVFSIPALIYMNPRNMYGFPSRVKGLAYFKICLLLPILVVNTIFTVVSFFASSYNAFGQFIVQSDSAWIVVSVSAFVLCFLRGIIGSALMPRTKITGEPLDSYYTKNNFFESD